MEDTRRGRGWRLMKQRLPSVPSFQSDLLITHGDGVFISLVMQIGKKRHTHIEWKATYHGKAFLSSFCVMLTGVTYCSFISIWAWRNLPDPHKHATAPPHIRVFCFGLFFYFFFGGEVKVGGCNVFSAGVVVVSLTSQSWGSQREVKKIKSHF